ncbi:hypothetical protein KR222_006493 [Zaprionus bogoriensis]|nr:hypothetical protein KR222_006493 [Zaprionus bogoriensis]
MNDIELIKLIKNYPILYDKDSARSAKNAANKDAAWKTISLHLGASERLCITRWKSIRDRFGKEFRRFQENPESPTHWDMFPRLLFLKDHYKHGLAKHKSLDGMIFEPRHRKPRRRPRLEQQPPDKRQRDDECEEPTEDIVLCQQLIELVKLHPVLYDRHKIRNSKNLAAKNDAWRAISESLNVSEQLCYNRWKQLRDRFAREYRNQQIDQSTAITWRYFNELMFLGRHFRKGVPLIVENIKKRGRPPKATQSAATGAQIWGADYPYSTDNEEQEEQDEELEDELQYDEAEDIEVISEVEQELIHMDLALEEQEEQQQQQAQQQAEQQQQQQAYLATHEAPAVSNTVLQAAATPSAAQLFGTVISNMETVLQQSKDCLQLLQQATPTANSNNNKNNSLLQKVQMLLDGLRPEQRQHAERKILHFLCECQIRTLDGQEIEDVAPCHIFN